MIADKPLTNQNCICTCLSNQQSQKSPCVYQAPAVIVCQEVFVDLNETEI